MLGWNRRNLRGDLFVSYNRGWGDGAAVFVYDDESFEGSTSRRVREDVDYRYDGETTEYTAIARLGGTKEVYDGFRFSSGVYASYHNQKFVEDADGAGTLELRDYTLVNNFASPFRQRVWALEDEMQFRVPLALEWDATSVLVFRTAVTVLLQRNEYETAARQSVELGGVPSPYFAGMSQQNHVIRYSNTTSLRAGFGVNIRDRLVADFLSSVDYYGSVDLTSFTYLTILYRF